jgi:hypothetical protein
MSSEFCTNAEFGRHDMQNIFFFLTNYDGCVKNGLKHIKNNVLYDATNIGLCLKMAGKAPDFN